MKKVFYSLVLFCSLALIGTSCKDNNNGNQVTPEVESGVMTIGSKTMDIATSKAVTYGQKNAIVFASKEMTADKTKASPSSLMVPLPQAPILLAETPRKWFPE